MRAHRDRGIAPVRRAAWRRWLRGAAPVGAHATLICASAALALSLPTVVRFLATNLLEYWSFVENQEVFLVSAEVMAAVGLLLLAAHGRRVWRDRRLAAAAASAGLAECVGPGGRVARRRARELKVLNGFGRDVMVIGSTGFQTFVEPTGDLHHALMNCRSARLMLLDPHGIGARVRARSLGMPEVTPDLFAEQVRMSIDFLRRLRDGRRDVRLKLYDDAPLLKLAILGDHVWVRHYHPRLGAESLPEYRLEIVHRPGGLYAVFYEYFLSRWRDPAIPELDLETEELIFRDPSGRELRREVYAQKKDR